MAKKSRWAFQKGVLWALELPADGDKGEKSPRPVQPRLATSFEEVSTGGAESLFAELGIADAERFSHRLARGRRCFAGLVDGKVATYGWVSMAAECIGELEREIRLPPGEAYIWDCLTLPAYRRHGLYSALLSHINITLARERCRRVWIGSNLENRPSLRGFANAGFQPVVSLTYLRLAGLGVNWLSHHKEAPRHLAMTARDAFSKEADWKMGYLVISQVNPANVAACNELDI